jgi:hypothetical protein
MDPRNNIATDLFYKIRSRFSGLKLGAETGEITISPDQARFFDFDYMEGENPIGHVSISLAEPNSMKVYFSHGITENMDDSSRDNWYGFLRELRQFAKRRLLSFDTRDIAKDNLDKRDYNFLSQTAKSQANMNTPTASVGESIVKESTMYGTKTMSYQKLMDTRLIVKHSQAVMDDTQPGARTRNISALFVENQDGERFKYPFIHLAGARAMQRHVANGGLPYDEVGKSIIGMSEQIAQLKSFGNYVVRNDLMNSENNSIVERSTSYLNNLRETIQKLARQNYYEQYKESFQAQQPLEVPQEMVEEFTEKFTVKNFKEDIKSVFPVLYRLMQEESNIGYDDIVAMTTEEETNEDIEIDVTPEVANPFDQFEAWVMGLGEASAIDSTDQEEQEQAINDLQQLVGQHFPAGVDGTNAIESLKGIIEDPQLYQEIKTAAKEDADTCVRPLVKAWLEQKAPEVVDQLDFGDMEETPVAAQGGDETAPEQVPQESAVKEDGSSTFTISNPDFDPEDEDSPEEIEVEVDWTTEGQYYAATQTDPASYPDIVLKSVVNIETGEELVQKLSPKAEDQLIDEISEREHESGYGDDGYDDYDADNYESAGESQKLNTQELAEFIQSFYDKESGTFPKGPEGVCTMVGKKFGEQAEQVARKFVERMAPQQATNNNPELAELARVRELAGIQQKASVSENFEDKTDELMDWHDKFRKYRGRNGDPLSLGMLRSMFDTGIVSDGWEENEYLKAAKQLGKEEEDWDDDDYERALEAMMPITKSMNDELEKILGVSPDEDAAAEVYEIITAQNESQRRSKKVVSESVDLDQTGWDHYEENQSTWKMAETVEKALKLPQGIMYFDDTSLVFLEKTVAGLNDTIREMISKTKRFMDANPEYADRAIQWITQRDKEESVTPESSELARIRELSGLPNNDVQEAGPSKGKLQVFSIEKLENSSGKGTAYMYDEQDNESQVEIEFDVDDQGAEITSIRDQDGNEIDPASVAYDEDTLFSDISEFQRDQQEGDPDVVGDRMRDDKLAGEGLEDIRRLSGITQGLGL